MKCKRSVKQGGGVFGCIFCCRERGGLAPGFEGLENFMLHLGAEHRDSETLLEGARCVLGRVAGVEEGFDVNIPPDGSSVGGGRGSI